MYIVITLLIVLVYLWRKKCSWDDLSKNCLFIYLIVWLISLLLSCFGLYDFPIPTMTTYAMQLLHIFAFFLGAFLCKRKIAFENYEHDLENEITYVQQSKFFKITCGLFLIYMLSLLSIYYQQMLIMMSFHDLRTAYYEGGLYGKLYDLIKGPILEPVYHLLIFIFAFIILRKRSFWAVPSLLSIIIYLSLSGGRFGYVLFLVAIVFTFLVFSKLFVNKKRIYSTLALSGSLVVLILIFVTNGRMNDVSSNSIEDNSVEVLQEHVLSYTSVPNVAFEYQIDHNIVERIGGYQYGALTLSSLENIFYSIVYKIGVNYKRPIAKLTDITQNDRIAFTDFNWNALYTSSLYYYCDLGILGLLLFPLLFGYFFRLSIQNIYKYKSLPSLLLAGAIFMKMIFSICMFGATDMYFALFLFVLYLLRKKKIAKLQ